VVGCWLRRSLCLFRNLIRRNSFALHSHLRAKTFHSVAHILLVTDCMLVLANWTRFTTLCFYIYIFYSPELVATRKKKYKRRKKYTIIKSDSTNDQFANNSYQCKKTSQFKTQCKG